MMTGVGNDVAGTKLRAVTVGVNCYKPTILCFEKTEMPSVCLKCAWSVQRP